MITMAVNIERTTPIPSVVAKPVTVPIPDIYNTTHEIIVVIFESTIAENALEKPDSTDARMLFPALISSLILSNMIQSASTAIPIESTTPAIPDRLKFTLNTPIARHIRPT